ncbi:hypothetical protein JKP88DRAFT_276201 [Tribonema minus]|uniref:Helicase ATP-binding domain-containing protein n=1 Tax=Tribonema minus TaxID=303371 RepID=A0A835Z7N7_9STRA|nr:hypothetical protein JKP88DRAFT_276201 [Tribonema minus]
MSSVSVNVSMLGKRSADADIILQSDRGTSIRVKQDWLEVEEAVFKTLAHFPAGATRAVHWSYVGFDAFLDCGLISAYTEARQLRIKLRNATPKDQFGFDGLVLMYDVSWEPAQVKHERHPVGPPSLGAFYSAITRIRRTRPDMRSHVVSTSGFTENMELDAEVFNLNLISTSAEELLAAAATAAPAAPAAGDDVANSQNLRACQKEALQAMVTAFERESGSFLLGLPPAAGKTLTCILFCLHEVANKFTTVVVASPRRAQVSQTKRRFDALLDHHARDFTSVLFDSDGTTDVAKVTRPVSGVLILHVTYKSSPKLAAQLEGMGDNVLVIYDECHHYNSNQLGALTALTQNIILVSGTPRGIPANLISDDEERRYLMSRKEAEEAGIIVPQRFIIPCSVNISTAGIPIKAEFIATTIMRITDPPRRLITYQPTIAAATELAKLAVNELARSGMHAEARVVTGNTSQAEREAIIRWMGEGSRQHV